MNPIARLISFGSKDADRRVAALLAPRSSDATNRYLASSTVVRVADGCTRRLREWWLLSQAGGAVAAWLREPWPVQYQTVAFVLLMATATHVALTWIQGPRPGWFWLVVPGMVLAFSVIVLVASRSAGESVDKAQSPR